MTDFEKLLLRLQMFQAAMLFTFVKSMGCTEEKEVEDFLANLADIRADVIKAAQKEEQGVHPG